MKTCNILKNTPQTINYFLVSLAVLAAMALPSRAGVLLSLEYAPITGTAVTNLTEDPSYPNWPYSYEVLASGMLSPQNLALDFGRLIRGYIEAPQTGAYTFWIASDDDSELWLSPGIDPAGKTRIAQNVGAVGFGAYLSKPAQQSAPISLVAGQKYYFEVLYKNQSVGFDFVQVQWQLPDGTYEDPISEKHLWPFPIDTTYPLAYSATPLSEAPLILDYYLSYPVDNLPASVATTEALPLDLTVTADGTQPIYVQWYSNGVPIPNANLLTCHIPRVKLSQNGDVYSVILTNANGQTNASTTLFVSQDTTPPTLVDALNLGNPAGDVVVVFSKPVDPVSATTIGNYALNNGASVTSAVMSTNPAAVLLRTTGLTAGTGYTLIISNVRDLAATPNTISPNPSIISVEQNLHTWFRMDETTGTTAGDSSGNNRNGTLINSVMPGYAGKVLRALKFDGLTGYVRCQNSADDFSTNGMTVAVWANPVNSTVNWARFIDYAVGSFSDNILFARNANTADLTFEVYNGGTSGGKVTASGALALNQWQHLAATMDASGNVILYKNGIAITNGTTHVPNAVARTNNFVAHSNMPQDGYYQGRMDDLRIYTRALAPEAVAALAAGGGPDDADPSIPIVSVAATVPTTALKNTPPGVFTITRTGSTNTSLTVNYTLGGTATNGVTYTNLSGSVVIPAGTNSAQVFVKAIDYSFQGLQQTVILSLTNLPNYIISDADSGTVIIQNNDVNPAAIVAAADNAMGVAPTTVDVWFAAPVANPSATTLANYTLLNAPGLTITNATLGNFNLRVVLGISGPVPAGAQLAVNGVLDPGGNTVPSQIPVRVRLTPANLVANAYHSPDNNRPACYTLATDGIVDNLNNAGGFDTFNGGNQPTEFVGLLYPQSQDFQTIKVDLGNQFGDGGSWLAQPKVYILKRPIDSNQTRPETDTNNWVQVAATLISGSQFQAAVDPTPSPNTPIVFDLSGLTPSQRTGYGWAVGGVKGNGGKDFISITEVRAYGSAQANLSLAFIQPPTNMTVVAGQRTKFTATAQSILGINFQWQKDGNPIPGATLSVALPGYTNESAYIIPPATPADNGAVFSVVLANAVGAITSQATLTVLPRTTPPSIVDATYDPSNNVVEVWFDESVDPSSSQNPASYTLNDPSVSIWSAIQDAQGFHVTLSLSGPPTVANLTLTAANILDLSGNTLSLQTVPVVPLVTSALNVVANQFQQGYLAANIRSTDGQANHDFNVTTWTTFGGPAGLSDFVGLQYAQPWVFGLIKVDLGYQYGDGGDWAAQPRVFLLKKPVNTTQAIAQIPPESDPADWVAVPATLVSGSIFDIMPDAPADTVPPPNTPIAFDLSQLPPSQRIGYGWAVGGVQGNGPNAQFVSIAELRAFGVPITALTNGTGAPQIAFDIAPLAQTQPAGFPLSYYVGVTGSQPLHFQWLHNGVNLVDNGRISGSQSSALTFSGTVSSDAGSYQVIVTNAFGAATSSVASLTLGGIALNNGEVWRINTTTTNVPIANHVLTLTDGGGGEARSAFLDYPVYIRAFRASYTYQDVGGNGADGACFVLQNDPRGTLALGGGGGSLGYSGITPSVALEFNIYSGNAPVTGNSGIAFRNNGTTGKPYDDSTPVNPASGNPIAVTVYYDGTTAFVTLSNTVTSGTFSTNYTADLPTILGADTAYVGFTGASGGTASKQLVSNFSFISLFPALSIQLTGPNTALLSWPTSGGILRLEECSDLGAADWSNVPGRVNVVDGQNQVTVSLQSGARFYRLELH